MQLRWLVAGGFASVLLLCAGCRWKVPVSGEPSEPVRPELLGLWVGENPDDDLRVAAFDQTHYVVSTGAALYRGFHSRAGDIDLVNLQLLTPGGEAQNKYMFVAWKLDEGGRSLTVRTINDEVIPASLESSEEIAAAITRNAANPKLFNDQAARFIRRPVK